MRPFSNFLKVFPGVVFSLGILVSAAACQVTDQVTRQITVSGPTASKLHSISSYLEAADAEMSFRCIQGGSRTRCLIRMDGSRTPRLNVETIGHPFENKPLALRLTEGTQAFQGALYRALGEQVSTKEFSETLLERSLRLENGDLKIRCTLTRDARPVYQCWTIIASRLVN